MSRRAVVVAWVFALSWGPLTAHGQGVANYGSGLDTPVGLEFDTTGNLYVSSSAGSRIDKIGPGGSPVTPFVTVGIGNPMGMAMDSHGILHVTDSLDSLVWRVDPTGAKTLFAQGIAWPVDAVFDAAGDLLVAEFRTGTVKRITPAGDVSVYVSGLHDGTNQKINAIAIDPAGDLYVGVGSTIQKVGPGGAPVTTFASGFGNVGGIVRGPSGEWYVSDAMASTLMLVSADGGVGTLYAGLPSAVGCVNGPLLDARFTHPYGLRVWQGKLFIADNGCYAVRVVDLSDTTPILPMTWSRAKSLYRYEAQRIKN